MIEFFKNACYHKFKYFIFELYFDHIIFIKFFGNDFGYFFLIPKMSLIYYVFPINKLNMGPFNVYSFDIPLKVFLSIFVLKIILLNINSDNYIISHLPLFRREVGNSAERSFTLVIHSSPLLTNSFISIQDSMMLGYLMMLNLMDIMWPISQSHFYVSCLCLLK